MTADRDRAIRIARRWLDRADLNPDGELALVAREFINEVSNRQDNADVGVIELPPWPFYRKAS